MPVDLLTNPLVFQFHADLYHMATEIMSEPGNERVMDTSQAFTDCVYQLLSATKIVTYS